MIGAIFSALALSLAMVLVGCSAGPGSVTDPATRSAAGPTTSLSSPAPAPSPTETPTSSPGSAVAQASPPERLTPKVSLKTYAHNQVSFSYPADWTVVRESSTSVLVLDEHQQRIASFNADIPRGASPCGGVEPARIITLEVIPLDLPVSPSIKGTAYVQTQFAFTLIEGKELWATMAITGFQRSADGTGCYITNEVRGPEDSTGDYSFGDCVVLTMDGARMGRTGAVATTLPDFQSVDEAREFMKTPFYSNFKNMLISLRIATR